MAKWTKKMRREQSKRIKLALANKKMNLVEVEQDELSQEDEKKLIFICGKIQGEAETLALQSGLPIKLVASKLREFFQYQEGGQVLRS